MKLFNTLSEVYWFFDIYKTRLSDNPQDNTLAKIDQSLWGSRKNNNTYKFLLKMVSFGCLKQEGAVKKRGGTFLHYSINKKKMKDVLESENMALMVIEVFKEGRAVFE